MKMRGRKNRRGVTQFLPEHMQSEQERNARPKLVRPPFWNEPARDPTPGFAGDAARIGRAGSDIQTIKEILDANHRAIATCADLLNKSQPSARGKIEVRWHTSAAGGATPVVVQWDVDAQVDEPKMRRLGRSGLMRRCNSRGHFADNLEETKVLVGRLEFLLTKREEILRALTNLAQWRGRAERSHRDFARIEEKKPFADIEEQISENRRKRDSEKQEEGPSDHDF